MDGLVCVFEEGGKWRYKLVSAAAVQLITPLINRTEANKSAIRKKTNKRAKNKNTVDIIQEMDNITIT